MIKLLEILLLLISTILSILLCIVLALLLFGISKAHSAEFTIEKDLVEIVYKLKEVYKIKGEYDTSRTQIIIELQPETSKHTASSNYFKNEVYLSNYLIYYWCNSRKGCVAFTISHEFAHLHLKHTNKDDLKQRELEADRLGLERYLGAGYDCDDVIKLFEKTKEFMPFSAERAEQIKKLCKE